MDYYQTLGVGKTASDVEIKAAYRKKALEWHPDRNKSPEASTKFKEVSEAYEVLSDPQKRQNYDQFGTSGGNPFTSQQQGPFSYSYQTSGGSNPFESFGGADPFEIFEQFFGGGFSASSGRSRARRQSYSLEIDFMEAVSGVEKEIELNGKNMKIKIPAGVDNGTRVRFGDFDIVLSIRPDKNFQREGQDIHVAVEISYPEAVLGTTVDAPTISGPVNLKVPAGTQPDTLIRLRGHGVKSPNSSRVGDEYVHIKIHIPSKVSGDQRRLLEELEKSTPKKRSGWF